MAENMTDSMVMLKLGVALHIKYPEKAQELIDRPLQEVADFINEMEGTDLHKGMSMKLVNEIVDNMLGVEHDAE